MIRTERKVVELLRILKDQSEPIGAKRLSELMAERGFVLSDRAVQYYLRYLDEMGFTNKIGNHGRVLTERGRSETDKALVDDRTGFIISKLERLAFRSTFNPETGTGDVAYNLSLVPEERIDEVRAAFDAVIGAGYGFFSHYRVLDRDPRVPKGSVGLVTVCSITMDGVFQHHGIPVRVAYGGTLRVRDHQPVGFNDLIGYRGTTIDPLALFISSGLTSIGDLVGHGSGVALANIRQVPDSAEEQVTGLIRSLRDAGFVFPVTMGLEVFNAPPDPYRLSIVAYSGMNLAGRCRELGIPVATEIGAGNIPFSRIVDGN
ncbi:MAG TPA: NrpR regulatory domain-containing protein [Methanoregulaceae archaeon]|nr:NrpR regulatory domain-containing protein [Methanoregulaceae archaeon]HOV68434.1 NrpR regulatory domain-containing protein [Methanoregulaceae archaeon]HQJ87748.1 NrpR regulatory domain-containing protein [Methanoregulaceae archaeon]